MKCKLIRLFLSLLLVLLFVIGCNNTKTKMPSEKEENYVVDDVLSQDNVKSEVPSEVIDGYMIGDYEIYKKAAKENGRKYDKLYVIGRFDEEPFEDGDLLLCYFVDENGKKYLLKMDSKKTELKNDYFNLKDKQICACGIYAGSLIKDPMPVIYTNKIYDIEGKDTIISQYYGEYYGDFDENGKVVSTDYDINDNTVIDFHSIQLQIPYNYMESELIDDYGLYIIQNDSIFLIVYDKRDLTNMLSDFSKKYKWIENIKKNPTVISDMYKNFFQNIKVSNIKDNSSNSMISYDISNSDMYGNGMVMLRNDGIYLLTLLTENASRFNRSQDFLQIVKSIKIFDLARQPKSVGIRKMTIQKDSNLSNSHNIKSEEMPKVNTTTETANLIETTDNKSNSDSNSINGVVNEYKQDIDDAKNQLNKEIDKAAEQVKDEMGLAGNVFGGYVDKYSDAYKKAIDTVGEAYKDVADDYAKAYQDILNEFGY